MDKKSHKISEIPYTGPKTTITQQLTKEEITDLLDGYDKTNFDDLKPFYHVRYYHKDKKTGEVQFKMGGTIIKINNEKNYIVLSSGSLSWSVQKENTIFYQAVPLSVMKQRFEEQYINKMQKTIIENTELLAYAKKLDTSIKELTNENNNLKATLNKKDKKITKLEDFIKKTKK